MIHRIMDERINTHDYILLIMNCKKYRYKAEKQKEGWLKSLPSNILYFHVIGEENMKEEYNFDNENRILYVKTPDDYNSLPFKVISAYEAIYNTYIFKHIFKTDDDQTLLYPTFFDDTIQKLKIDDNNMYHYGGYSFTIDDYYSDYHLVHPELPPNIHLELNTYCSGRFYFLSSDAVLNLIHKKPDIKNTFFEDYSIGFYLDGRFKENILFIETHHYFSDE